MKSVLKVFLSLVLIFSVGNLQYRTINCKDNNVNNIVVNHIFINSNSVFHYSSINNEVNFLYTVFGSSMLVIKYNFVCHNNLIKRSLKIENIEIGTYSITSPKDNL